MSRSTPRVLLPAAAVLAGVLTLLPATSSAGAGAPPVRTPAVTTAAAPAGTSGSIVFIKAANVWIARGDGSHARRLTRDGTRTNPYSSPSEADTGTIAVAHGQLVVRMTQSGRVLKRYNPPPLRNSAGELMDGAVNDVALSPDGRTIAYSFVRYSCPIGADCLVRYGTGYLSATTGARTGRATYYRAASWVSPSRTLQTGGYGSQVMLQDTGRPAVHWFDDRDYAFPSTDLADGELSRDGRWLAQVRGYGATSSIIWYRVSGNARAGRPPAVPTFTCVTGGEAAHASPTWSPDSTALAWTGRTGIWIKRGVGSCASPQSRLVIPGGSSPDWSPTPLR